jgi:bacteriorhodopsin
MQMTTMLVGEGAKLDVHGCKTVDMASSFGKALLEFVFIVFACITLLIGINAAKSKAAGRVLFPATFVTGIASISYFSMASGGGWVIAPDCRQLFVARYMDWLITTPLLLIDLGIVAGVSRWDIMALCLSDSACSPLSYVLLKSSHCVKCPPALNAGGTPVVAQLTIMWNRSVEASEGGAHMRTGGAHVAPDL